MASAKRPVALATVGSSTQPILAVRGLTKYFSVGGLPRPRHLHALEDASFDLVAHQIVALVGESGSGKSTTARLIARVFPATRGKILFQGKDVLRSERRRASLSYRGNIQMILQDPFSSLNPVHTISYHLTQPLVIHKKARGRHELGNRVHDLLDAVGLPGTADFAQRYPHQLSGGQRQRVAIARALAVDPLVILADEPISMLDVSIRMSVLNLLARLKEERGISYLYITHDIASARYISDRTLVMYAGHMVEGAESDDLIGVPAHPYTRLLLAAVPNPRERAARSSPGTRGDVPPLIDPPPGCPFAARCPHVMAICRQAMPGRERLDPNHWVRCHLYGPGSDTHEIANE